ncbi:MAG: CRISPR-associated protein, partial [Clostridiales bacterium]|nr:CRISPR-associated protein [Clostridiales bacterium]
TQLSRYETGRITYHYDLKQKNEDELADWISGFPGPRLVILNTVQNAAVLANHFSEKFGRAHVEHLSTALTAIDREKTFNRIRARLTDSVDDDWTLIATSCVEAGVDFSFRTGFRELGSLVSLLQAAGRVNREGLHVNAQMWSFCTINNVPFNKNPGIQDAASVLRKYFVDGKIIDPCLSTKSIADEIRMYGFATKHSDLVMNEKNCQFPKVNKGFKVIDTNTRIAVVDKEIANRLRFGYVDWSMLQLNSVQIAAHIIRENNVIEVVDNIYHWNLGYDGFLGYMAGVVKNSNLFLLDFGVV